jgi:serine/threonine protein kinase
MTLYEYRNSNTQFHWENSEDSHKAFGNSETWPLKHLSRLGNRQVAKALVWASQVTIKHGFEDVVADKIVKYSTDEEKRKARVEVENLKKLRHNHIVAFLGSYAKGNNLGILMYPVAAWDLDEFLSHYAYSQSRQEMIRPWFSCLTRTLLFLHTQPKPVKHRDIKPANILIDKSGAIFLTDFGLSKEYTSYQDTVTHSGGGYTIKYASPKRVDPDAEQGVESDIFSLGCVLFEMATVSLGKNLDDMYLFIRNHAGLQGTVDVEYHRDFKTIQMWTDVLQKSVHERESAPWEVHLVDEGLPMILRMINECAFNAVDSASYLREVCTKLDPISPRTNCPSCRQKVFIE